LFGWGVEHNDSNLIIGTATLLHLDIPNKRAEIGFALAKNFWGSGYASEAVTRLLVFAFEELGIHRIEADVDPNNLSSLKLLEKQGFQREGLMRERWQILGEVQDSVILGLLKHEWTGSISGD